MAMKAGIGIFSGMSSDPEHEGALVKALQDVHAAHEQQMKILLRTFQAEQEKHLEIVVTRAVREAVFEAASAPSFNGMLPLAPQVPKAPGDWEAPEAPEVPEAPAKDAGAGEACFSPDSSKGEQRSSTLHRDSGISNRPYDCSERTSEKKSVVDMTISSRINDMERNAGKVGAMVRTDTGNMSTALPAGCSCIPEKVVRRLVQHPLFDNFSAVMILANAIIIGTETHMNAIDPKENSPSIFQDFDLFFTLYFTLELTLRLVAEKKRFICGSNREWNVFDTFIVLCALTEQLLRVSTNLTAIRAFRVMRLVRAVRVIRTLRMFADLRAMVKGIFISLLSLLWAFILLFIICTIFAIFITQVVTEHRLANQNSDDLLSDSFGSLWTTLYTLYKAITGGQSWGELADPLFDFSIITGILFCIYVSFALFAVLNVITGVFVNNAIKVNQDDEVHIIMEQTQARKKHMEQVKNVFKLADEDGNGRLTVNELMEVVDNPFVQAYFNMLDLSLENRDNAASLFSLLDFDGSGSVEIDEFVSGCWNMKGYARSLDLAKVRHDQLTMGNELANLINASRSGQENNSLNNKHFSFTL